VHDGLPVKSFFRMEDDMKPQRRRPRIGLFMTKLSAEAPRGVIRVARAIAELWADSGDAELLALSDPVYHHHDIVFHSCELGRWLQENPLVRGPEMPPLDELSYPAVSINDVDAIVSFECYDPIWDWPTELHSCRMIGMFSDAIPFRINEGWGWDPARYYRAVGTMTSRAHAIFCISEATYRDLISFFPIASSKGFVAYCGHDRERFLPRARIGNGSNGTKKWRSPRRTIAMIGTLEPRKNQSGVLRACRHFHPSPDQERPRLLLIGERSEHSPYQNLEEQASHVVDIEYTNYLEDDSLAQTLRQCDVFVFPSLWEGFGIPILEAMTAGVPVVTSEISSMPEVGGEFATYCDPYDPLSIAQAVTSTIGLSPPRRARLIESARAWAGTFTWERMRRSLHDRIEDLLNSRAPCDRAELERHYA
jgi:glycosyltransferase involved in cell wall biosynthesis